MWKSLKKKQIVGREKHTKQKEYGHKMKFWKKIFLYSVTLFLVLLSGTGALLVEKGYGENLQAAVNRTINKYIDVEYTIYLNTDYISAIDIDDMNGMKNWLEVIINGYATNGDSEPVGIEVYTMNNVQIMSHGKHEIEDKRPELSNATAGEKQFIIREIKGKKYVFVSSIINIKNTDLKLVLSKDISFVYEKRARDYQFLFMIDIGMSCILAVGMFIISKRLTKPIVELSQITQEIAMGNYDRRVIERKNNDEIGILEENFNMMINQIENNINELQALSQAKQRFIDSLNHEIKTPITSIVGYSELLLKGKVNETTKIKALSYIHSEAKRLEMLNSTMLKLILLREEKAVRVNVNMATCIQGVEGILKYKLENQEIDLIKQIEEAQVLVDPNQLEILLINLLDNGIKASANGGTIRIEGNLDETSRSYILKIRDYGIGIPKIDLDKILEPFYMVDKARTRKYNGIGLGLTICNEICQSNGITLDIQSQEGEGTLVILIFQVGGQEQ